MKDDTKNKWARLFFVFLTGCLVGWVYEVTLGFIYGYGFINRGFLYGPYLPIYGIGLVLLTLSLDRLIKKPIRAWGIKINPLLVFLGIVAITTVLEYIAGYVLLQEYHLRLWDYSNYSLNYQGIVSFNTSIRFGIGGMFLLYVLVPLTDKIINRLNVRTKTIIMFTAIAVMTIDLAATLLK